MEKDHKIPFGIYKGTMLSKCPPEYLLDLYDSRRCYGSVKQYIKDREEELRERIK